MLSEIKILRAAGRNGRIEAEVDPVNFMIELALDAQRWVRTGPLGSPFHPGRLRSAGGF